MFGKENARKVISGINKSPPATNGKYKGWAAQGVGDLAICKRCKAMGHCEKECPTTRHVIRLDSSNIIRDKTVRKIIEMTGAESGYSGSRGPQEAPRKFATLLYSDKKAQIAASLHIFDSYCCGGVLSGVRLFDGLPTGCWTCGHIDGEGGQVEDHRANH